MLVGIKRGRRALKDDYEEDDFVVDDEGTLFRFLFYTGANQLLQIAIQNFPRRERAQRSRSSHRPSLFRGHL